MTSPLPRSAIHAVRFQVGLHEERSLPGAIAYQSLAALTTSQALHEGPRRAQPAAHVATHTVALALTEAPRQQEADTNRVRLLEVLAPLLAIGQPGLPLAIECLRQGIVQDGHQVLVWSDGGHARLLFQGDHRIIYLHQGQASLIRPTSPSGIGHLELPLVQGDTLILVAHATHAQLPLGTVAAMAREAATPQALCQHATARALASDALSHHAALALTVGLRPAVAPTT